MDFFYVYTAEFFFALVSEKKTRVPGISYGILCVILHLAILITYQSVTHTHTDGQTHNDGIYRA